jgi:hypothetical protein
MVTAMTSRQAGSASPASRPSQLAVISIVPIPQRASKICCRGM